nr:hypothetical protein [Sinorhizobium meliloti]
MTSATSSPLAVTATGLAIARNGRKTRHPTRSMSSPEWEKGDGILTGWIVSPTLDAVTTHSLT